MNEKDADEVAYRRQRSTGTKTPPDGGEAQKCANPRLVLEKGAKDKHRETIGRTDLAYLIIISLKLKI